MRYIVKISLKDTNDNIHTTDDSWVTNNEIPDPIILKQTVLLLVKNNLKALLEIQREYLSDNLFSVFIDVVDTYNN